MIAHNKPTLGPLEEEAAIAVLRSGWVADGPEVKAFENEFCQFLGLPAGHAVAVSNGTAALFLALWTLGARGRKVAFPVYACSALRHAVAMAGAQEVLVDTEGSGPNLDMPALKSAGMDLAIVPHLFGLPGDVSKCPAGLPIIEDCAQALGARLHGKPVGLHGEIGIYSFYATKLMTTGGHGGMVVSKSKDIIERIHDYVDFDCRHDRLIRFNFKMTDVQAAIGRVQLRRLPEFLSRRSAIFARYQAAVSDLLDLHGDHRAYSEPVRYRAVMKTDAPENVISILKSKGISAIIPVEDWELLGDAALFPNAAALSKSTVSLPLYPSLIDDDVARVIAGIQS